MCGWNVSVEVGVVMRGKKGLKFGFGGRGGAGCDAGGGEVGREVGGDAEDAEEAMMRLGCCRW